MRKCVSEEEVFTDDNFCVCICGFSKILQMLPENFFYSSKKQDLEHEREKRLDCRIFIILTFRFNKHIESSINIEIFVFMMFGTTERRRNFQGLMDKKNLSFFFCSVAKGRKFTAADEINWRVDAFAVVD